MAFKHFKKLELILELSPSHFASRNAASIQDCALKAYAPLSQEWRICNLNIFHRSSLFFTSQNSLTIIFRNIFLMQFIGEFAYNFTLRGNADYRCILSYLSLSKSHDLRLRHFSYKSCEKREEKYSREMSGRILGGVVQDFSLLISKLPSFWVFVQRYRRA